MNELEYIRSLASQVLEITVSDEMTRRRNLWRNHNSLKLTSPPIFVRAFAAAEVPELNNLICTNPELRGFERRFKDILYRYSLNDDSVFEPWYTVRAAFAYPASQSTRWGFPITVTRPDTKGAFIFNPQIVKDGDIDKLVRPIHSVDEIKTAEIYEKTREILKDIIPVVIDRSPVYSSWTADISTDLAYMRGIEGMMWDMADRPEWLHKLVGFMSEGVLSVQDTAEAAGHFTLYSQENQAISYAAELPEPSADTTPVSRNSLWVFCASQETAVVSPAMWNEFILQYQKPIYSKYGLLSYGCCEDMTHKFPILKREMKNLRRVAVTPWANLRSCSEQIGSDYVLSWRPSPSDAVSFGFDKIRAKNTVREAFQLAGKNRNHIDVTLKDVETVSHKPDSVRQYVKAVREVIDEGDWVWK